ncbi:hypothetical protein ZIOFF_025989 [Zingiber officinale]|uniref:HD domain-containing protein n=1 Tax=Zingiber officinale TaxID=94328 RepID=A0A8J5GWQ3_ZINOF|nr:hypothetical protein ZIOFF_025989 [Zingiber officinale]
MLRVLGFLVLLRQRRGLGGCSVVSESRSLWQTTCTGWASCPSFSRIFPESIETGWGFSHPRALGECPCVGFSDRVPWFLVLGRCVKMALVHDIAEAIVGDITPSDGVPKLEKSRREREALDYMCKVLGGGSRAKEIGELWMEYEDNSSPEAKLVKDFDKVEMILQALEYEDGFAYTAKQGIDLEEFFESTAGKFKTDVGKAWASEIVSRRKRGK